MAGEKGGRGVRSLLLTKKGRIFNRDKEDVVVLIKEWLSLSLGLRFFTFSSFSKVFFSIREK